MDRIQPTSCEVTVTCGVSSWLLESIDSLEVKQADPVTAFFRFLQNGWGFFFSLSCAANVLQENMLELPWPNSFTSTPNPVNFYVVIDWGDFYGEEKIKGVCVFGCLVDKRRREYYSDQWYVDLTFMYLEEDDEFWSNNKNEMI